MVDEYVIRQGEEGKVLYIILIGGVNIYMKEENTKEYMDPVKVGLFDRYRKQLCIKNAIAENKKKLENKCEKKASNKDLNILGMLTRP